MFDAPPDRSSIAGRLGAKLQRERMAAMVTHDVSVSVPQSPSAISDTAKQSSNVERMCSALSSEFAVPFKLSNQSHQCCNDPCIRADIFQELTNNAVLKTCGFKYYKIFFVKLLSESN